MTPKAAILAAFFVSIAPDDKAELGKEDSMNIYWPVYLNLERAVDDLTFAIHVDDKQMATYSSKITDLILRAAAEIESLAKELYAISGGTKTGNIKFDEVALTRLFDVWKLDKKKIIISSPNCFQSQRILLPFAMTEPRTGDKLGRLTFGWNNAYQNLKHDRARSIAFGSLRYLFEIMGALYVLNVYFRAETFELGKDAPGISFPRRLGSSLYSVELSANPSHDGSGNYLMHPEFDESIYYVNWTKKTGAAFQESIMKMQAEQTRLLLAHPKFQSYIRDNDIRQYKGENLPWDALGQEDYINTFRHAQMASPIFTGVEYEALINKGPPK